LDFARKLKPHLQHTTLICADTTNKVEWSLRAIEKAKQQCTFAAVKLLTDRTDLSHAVKIPKIDGLDGYSKFCVREMAKHVDTPYALVVQYDGYPLNGQAWSEDFTEFDYVGAPFNPSGLIGNGGFSLRSKRLLDYMAQSNWEDFHPEDSCISIRHRSELEEKGFKIATPEVARRFAIESRSWDNQEWRGTPNAYTNEFGFHSLLTPLPPKQRVCNVMTHSGDAGDIIYGLAAAQALDGGMLFITPDNKYPYPLNSRWSRMGGEAAWVDNLVPLIEAQPYILKCRYTHGHPASTTHDLNKFRLPWRNRTAKDFDSILKLHMDAFDLLMPSEPWLSVPDPIVMPNKWLVVNRTARYHNDKMPWDRIVPKYAKQMLFVGTEQEYGLFRGFAPGNRIDYCNTKDALELARVIAGARVFIGNQSLALAIAHGLSKPVIAEEWSANANCHLERSNAIYVRNGDELPAHWL
jgi:hypothetical protein